MERAWSGDGRSTIEHRSSSWALRKHREAAGVTQVSQIRSTTCGQDPISGLPATHLLRAARPTPLYTLHVCNYLRNAAPAGGCAFAFPIAQRPRCAFIHTLSIHSLPPRVSRTVLFSNAFLSLHSSARPAIFPRSNPSHAYAHTAPLNTPSTFPANLLPALPLFCSLLAPSPPPALPSPNIPPPPDGPLLLIIGNGPRLSPLLPEIALVFAVRCSRYSFALLDSGIAGRWTGTSAPFWISSSAIGKAFGCWFTAVGPAFPFGVVTGLGVADPAMAGSAAARARKTACVPRERSCALTLPRRAMPYRTPWTSFFFTLARRVSSAVPKWERPEPSSGAT